METVDTVRALLAADSNEHDALITTLKETRDMLKQKLAEKQWHESAAYFIKTRGEAFTAKAREIRRLDEEVRELATAFSEGTAESWVPLVLGVVLAVLLTFFILGADAFPFFTKSHRSLVGSYRPRPRPRPLPVKDGRPHGPTG